MNLMMILAMMVLVVKRCLTTTWSAHQYQILDKVIPVIRDDDLGNDGGEGEVVGRGKALGCYQVAVGGRRVVQWRGHRGR